MTNELSRQARLTIRIDGYALAFSAVAPQTEQGVVYSPYTVKSTMSIAANLRQALKEADLPNNGEWKRAHVMLGTPVMLEPTEEFQREQASLLYQHTITGMEGHTVISNVIPPLNAVAVYSIHKDLRTVIEDHFEDVKYNRANYEKVMEMMRGFVDSVWEQNVAVVTR